MFQSIEHHCDRFVACEKDLMNLHQACSKNSRNATAVECNLTADFNELGKLMKARVFEFQQCIASENFALSQKDSLEAIEIPVVDSLFFVHNLPI